MVKFRGYEIKLIPIRDSYNRRALQLKNKIIEQLACFGLTEDDIDVHIEQVAMKKAPAFVTWYYDGRNQYCRFNGCNKFVENLYMIHKLIEIKINELIAEKITIEEFVYEFTEEDDIKNQHQNAREELGLDEKVTDWNTIQTKYKELAKEHHPDMPNGSAEKFKAINKAHKVLKSELQ